MNGRREESLSLTILLTIPLWLLSYGINLKLIADVAALFGSILILRWIWLQIVKQQYNLRFLRIGAVSMILIQNVSWIISTLTHFFLRNQSLSDTLRIIGRKSISVSDYSLAIVYVSLFALMLCILAQNRFVRKWEMELTTRLNLISDVKMKYLVRLGSVFLLIEIYLIFSGVIGQRTLVVNNFDKGELPIWFTFFELMLNLHLIILGIQISRVLSANNRGIGPLHLFVLLSVIVLLFTHFNQGRIQLMYSFLAIVFWSLFFFRTRLNLSRTFVFISILLPVILIGFLYSNFIRSSESGLDVYRDSAVIVVDKSWTIFQKREMVNYEVERTIENLSFRTLLANPLARSISLNMSNKHFLFGKDLFHSAIWTIPRPLFPEKVNFSRQEELLYENFPIGEKDTVDSVYLSSYADFGWMGLFIYPVLIVLFYLFGLGMTFYARNVVYVLAFTATFLELFTIGVGESSTITWLVSLRALIAMWFFLSLVDNVVQTVYRK